MIKSTLLKNSAIVAVLFDYGSRHTFIAKTFIGRIGLSVGDLGYDLVVSTSTRTSLTTGVCEGCQCCYTSMHLVDGFYSATDQGV